VSADIFLKPVAGFIFAGAKCRLSWILVFMHAAWFFAAVANMSPPSRQFVQFLDQVGGSSATVFAGRPFHFSYESNHLKCLFVADLPSMIATMPLAAAVDVLVKVLRVGRFVGSYLLAGLLLLTASLEWLVLGKLIEDLLKRNPACARVLQKLNRYWAAAIIVIVLFTMITASLVDRRSRELGFRHAGFSLR
jgi:hypothetical protein